MAQGFGFRKDTRNGKKTIPFYSANKDILFESTEGYHFSVGSILGDGSINRDTVMMHLEQRSARFLYGKRRICLNTGILKYDRQNQFGKTLKLAKGAIGIKLPFTWRTKERYNGPKKTLAFRRSWGFSTSAFYHDPKWRDLFYIPTENAKSRTRFRKRIPPDIKDYFWGDLALAIFFLDDGWYDWQRHTVRLSTGEFRQEECELLVDCLKENFGLDSTVYCSRGKPHHIFVKRTSYPEFFRRVKPFVSDLTKDHPRYALNKAMKNKVLPEPVVSRIGRPRKTP